MPLVSRQEAFDAGDRWYFTGEACSQSHMAPRFTRNGRCVVCTREAWRNWANANREAKGDQFRARVRMQLARDPVGVMLRGVKSRANARGIPFSLTRDDITIPENCPCCSRKLEARTGEFKQGARPSSPSLDRIEPKLGYVSGNVAVICSRCNALKYNATAEELRTVARWIETAQTPKKRLAIVS